MTPKNGDEPEHATRSQTDGRQPSASAEPTTEESRSHTESTGGDVPTVTGADVSGETAEITKHKPPEQERFDWRGWLLVAVVFVSFLVFPAIVLYLPEIHGALSLAGLSLTQAYVVFPMIPAILLGGVAVWAAIRSRTAG